MPADRSAAASPAATSSAVTCAAASAAVKPRKPPACDRCKAKRVLCHPSPAGCPRCLEAEVKRVLPVVRRPHSDVADDDSQVHETPVNRKPPRPRARTAVQRAPGRPSPAFVPVPTLRARSSADSPGDCITQSAAASPSSNSDQRLWTELPFELDDSLVKDLIPLAGLRFTHPFVHASGLYDPAPGTVADLAALASDVRILAFCAMAAGALLSCHPSIVGSGEQNPSTMAEAERLGPDLRDFGRRRLGAFAALRDEALRRAKGGDTFIAATATNAAICFALDFLFAVDRPHDAPRIFLATHLSHVRVLAPLRSAQDVAAGSTHWSMQLAATNLAGLGDGTPLLLGLAHSSLVAHIIDALLINSTSTDLSTMVEDPGMDQQTYAQELADALRAPSRPGQWPRVHDYAVHCVRAVVALQDQLAPRARAQPLNEASVLSTLSCIDLLRSMSLSLVAHADRLLPVASDQSLFRAVPFSRVQALKSARFVAAMSWTSVVLPLYHELRSRRAGLQSPSSSHDTISSQFALERLDLYVRQARAYAFAALEAVMAAIERTQHISFWTHLQPRLLPQWAEFLIGEFDSGHTHALGARLGPICQTLSATLLKLGYVYSTPHLDHLIERLDAVVQLENFQAALSLPPDNPLTFLTLLSTDPTFFLPPDANDALSRPLAGAPSTPAAAMSGLDAAHTLPPSATTSAVMAGGADGGIPVGAAPPLTPSAVPGAEWMWAGL